jgi:hypothetical protein
MENIEQELSALRKVLYDLKTIHKDGSLIITQGDYQELLIDVVSKQIKELQDMLDQGEVQAQAEFDRQREEEEIVEEAPSLSGL